jgi:hypothetical protein
MAGLPPCSTLGNGTNLDLNDIRRQSGPDKCSKAHLFLSDTQALSSEFWQRRAGMVAAMDDAA